jgi:hypothetical protein
MFLRRAASRFAQGVARPSTSNFTLGIEMFLLVT